MIGSDGPLLLLIAPLHTPPLPSLLPTVQEQAESTTNNIFTRKIIVKIKHLRLWWGRLPGLSLPVPLLSDSFWIRPSTEVFSMFLTNSVRT